MRPVPQSVENTSPTGFVAVPHLEAAQTAHAAPSPVLFSGAIGHNEPISLAAVRWQLDRVDLRAGLRFDINSSGGMIDEALKIYTHLRALPVPVSGRAVGCCESAAVLVLLAAGHRVAKEDARILVHACRITREDLPPSTSFTARDLGRRADDLQRRDSEIADLMAARTGHYRHFFEDQMQHEESLSHYQWLESGLVHEIEGLTPRCGMEWAAEIRALSAARWTVPKYFLTDNYFEACRTVSAMLGRKENLR
jgi:ATP-dependent protease ClpP protease subunit